MAIEGFDAVDDFKEQLNRTLSPSRPIDTIERLHGRKDEWEEIEQALAMDGRHVFIYGDRGVGKSSLAAAMSHQLQSSAYDPISVAGSPEETFASMLRNICIEATDYSSLKSKSTATENHLGLNYVGIKSVSTEAFRDLGVMQFTIATATNALSEVAEQRPNTIVVVDEFDRIPALEERNKFADLLKHLGDARVQIRFIFTGIGSSLEELIGAHGSAIRQLHTIELERLSWDGRWDIAIQAANDFGLGLPDDIYIRLAQVSDGYPYYVHLIMEKILWQCFNREETATKITWDDFRIGLRSAIASIAPHLKKPYETVLLQRTQDLEPVLWATADGESLYRTPAGYYASYESVMEQLKETPMKLETFRRRLRKLQTDALGILEIDPIHKEFRRYRENMLRGYVRMQAEASDIQLYGEQIRIPNPVMHTPSRVKTGYKGSHPPRGYPTGR